MRVSRLILITNKFNYSIQTTYCRLFNSLISAKGFQKWIGYTNVKSAPVHAFPRPAEFFIHHNWKKFRSIRLWWTKEMPWIWIREISRHREEELICFSFTGALGCSSTSTSCYLKIGLYLNDFRISSAVVSYDQSPLSVQSTINLIRAIKFGYRLKLWHQGRIYMISGLVNTTPPPPIHGHILRHYTHFTGFMLEEKIVASLWLFYVVDNLKFARNRRLIWKCKS